MNENFTTHCNTMPRVCDADSSQAAAPKEKSQADANSENADRERQEGRQTASSKTLMVRGRHTGRLCTFMVVGVAVLLGIASFAQAPKAIDPIDSLRKAIEVLEQELPELAYPQGSLLARRAEKKQQEMLDIQSKLMAVELIQKAIQALEAERQKVRVVPALTP